MILWISYGIKETLLDVCRILIDFGLVVLIWIVQLIIYPSFSHVADKNFHGWHKKYTLKISFIVFPLMVGQFIIYLYQVVAESRFDLSILLLVVLLLWAHTFLIAAPLHRRMEYPGDKANLFQELVRVNWWRVVGWNLIFLWSFVHQLQ